MTNRPTQFRDFGPPDRRAQAGRPALQRIGGLMEFREANWFNVTAAGTSVRSVFESHHGQTSRGDSGSIEVFVRRLNGLASVFDLN
jgi:hypothetical protein